MAAERREALERREREEALRAAAVLAPPKREEPVPVVKEFREEPRREERKPSGRPRLVGLVGGKVVGLGPINSSLPNSFFAIFYLG